MATTDDTGAATGEKPSPDQIQADIAQARNELGETIEALSAKLDVKTRASNKAGEVKQQVLAGVHDARTRAVDLSTRARVAVTDDEGRPTPALLAAAAAAAAVLIGAAVMWGRRR